MEGYPSENVYGKIEAPAIIIAETKWIFDEIWNQ